MVSGQFTPEQLTPGQLTPGQYTPGKLTPGRFTPRYTLPFTIDLKIITRGEMVNCPWVGQFTPGIHLETNYPEKIYPGQFTPRCTLPLRSSTQRRMMLLFNTPYPLAT